MKSAVVDFYVMSYAKSFAAVILFSFVLLVIYRKLNRTWLRRLFIAAGVLLSSLLILEVTIFTRTPGGYYPPVLEPFASIKKYLAGGNEEMLRVNLMNIYLFMPLGMFSALGEKKHPVFLFIITVLMGCVLSAGVEYLQYTTQCGVAEIDDILCNTLGAAFGWILIRLEQLIFKRR